jgi:uncharacterized protein
VRDLGCAYSGQVLSYQKMLGQLKDAGNTTTLAHYPTLLQYAGLLAGLPKYAGQQVCQRASSPKLQALNTALMTAPSQRTLAEAKRQTEYWGRLVESAIGAALFNGLQGSQAEWPCGQPHWHGSCGSQVFPPRSCSTAGGTEAGTGGVTPLSLGSYS